MARPIAGNGLQKQKLPLKHLALCIAVALTAESCAGFQREIVVRDPSIQIACQVPARHSNAVDALRDSKLELHWASAHRGNRPFAIDNSLAGIRSAATAGIPLIEVDVRFTAEGEAFLFHDRTLRRENIRAPDELYGKKTSELNSKQLAQLRLLDSRASPVTRLSDALRIIKPFSSALQLDVKSENERFVYAMLESVRKLGQMKHVVVQTEDPAEFGRLRAHAPDIAILARAFSQQDVEAFIPLKPDIIQIDAEFAFPETIRPIQQSGIRVLVKTLTAHDDVPSVWRGLSESGVNILLSDNPVQLQGFLRSNICAGK